MSLGCFLIGELSNEMAKVAKVAFSLNIAVENIKDLKDIKNFSNKYDKSIIFLFSLIDKFDLTFLSNSTVITCGKREDFTGFSSSAHLDFPIKKEELTQILSKMLDSSCGSLVCADSKMCKVIEMCKKIALTNASVLITGESGTGKEMVTKFIHQNSNRASNSFIAINCAAIPDNLLESELFGHEKGAFTGAITQHIGKFEEAHNGTLFLDEISEMSIHLQAKLLRAVQEKEITRLGGNKIIKVNCRIIASSNRDLKAYVDEMKFRADLYYRLNVINIDIPPLRERPQDIIALGNYFIKKYCEQNKCKEKSFSDNAIKIMLRYDWPGNVRELENAIHRSVILDSTDIINTIHGINPTNNDSSSNFIDVSNINY